MTQEKPAAGFWGGMVRIVWYVFICSPVLERFGIRGKRRANALSYLALKRMIPALHAFSRDPTGPMGVMEGDIDKMHLREYLGTCRRRSLALLEQ